MALVLQSGEKMELQIKMDSVYGKGTLYVTSNAVVIESEKKGIFFQRLHSQISSIEAPDKKKIKITWPEGVNLYDFTFKVKDAQTHVKEIVENHNYDENFPDLMGVNIVILSEKEKKEIIEKRITITKNHIVFTQKKLEEANLKLNMIPDDDPDKTNKILEAAKDTSKYQNEIIILKKYEKDIPNVIMNRSRKIPKDIPNFLCWNDTWYDIESNCYVTFNNYWRPDIFKEYDDVMKFYSKNKIPNVYAIPLGFVTYQYGYPILTKEYADLGNGLQDFIPTLTDEMLNDDMISKKFGLDFETVGNGLPVKIKNTIGYNTSKGSRLILKNGQQYTLTRKETIFLANRKYLPKEEIVLLP